MSDHIVSKRLQESYDMSNICTCVLIPAFERMPSKQMPGKEEKL